MKTNGIILAAGLSSRMKAFKPLLELNGKTMIENCVDSMFHGNVNQVIVVLGYRAGEIESLLRKHYDCTQLLFIHNHKYAETDMLTSVKIGISALEPCDAFYLLPGDMPAIGPQTFLLVKETLIRTHAWVTFPTIDGHRKHPPLISWECIEPILQFDKEGGLREVWKHFENQISTVPVEDFGCLMDSDTKADYDRLLHYMEAKQ